jgi:DNA invertase Pin-like site-specific DNA recombinase
MTLRFCTGRRRRPPGLDGRREPCLVSGAILAVAVAHCRGHGIAYANRRLTLPAPPLRRGSQYCFSQKQESRPGPGRWHRAKLPTLTFGSMGLYSHHQMEETSVTDAVAYLRTSSAGNVGSDKDSDKRQRVAIEAFARARSYSVVETFYDAAVSGADPIADRPGFKSMLERIAGNGVRVILVESPDRFARDLAVQLAGHDFLKSLGVELIPTTAPNHFLEDTPTAVLVRQVLGAISEFEKTSLVAKLRGARERKRAVTGKCEGRRSHSEIRPEVVELARSLRRRRPKGGRRSLQEIAAELERLGHVNSRGRPFSASAIASMLRRK